MQITTPSIIPNSPKRNYNFYMNIEKNGNLLIAGGGMVGDRLNYVGTIMELSNNTWSSFQEDGIKEQMLKKKHKKTSTSDNCIVFFVLFNRLLPIISNKPFL